MTTPQKQVLQHLSEGDWDTAHTIIQDYRDPLSCMIHGYLHLAEGDKHNAAYWYQKASHSIPASSLEEELSRLINLAQNA